jgi:hypothetical protein
MFVLCREQKMKRKKAQKEILGKLHIYAYNVAYYRRVYVWSHFAETWARDQWSTSSGQADAVKEILLHVLGTEPEIIEETEKEAQEEAYKDFAEDYAPLD